MEFIKVEEKFPNLPIPLINHLKIGFLEIKEIDQDCIFFNKIKAEKDIKEAKYVIKPIYISKQNSLNQFEQCVFINENGKVLKSFRRNEFDYFPLLEDINFKIDRRNKIRD